MHQIEAMPSPWPGPVPYDEDRRRFFHGREEDLERVIDSLANDGLVLLSAASGIGKTSFIRAGLVPEMRRLRHLAFSNNDPEARPAVIVVRDWLNAGADEPDLLLASAIRTSLLDDAARQAVAAAYEHDDEMVANILSDLEELSSVPSDNEPFRYIINLQKKAGALALILDQFEEALQGSRAQTESLLKLLVQLYRSRAIGGHIELLISYRREFEDNLLPIWQATGNREKITWYLPQLANERLEAAVTRSASDAGLHLAPEALSRLLEWLQDDRRQSAMTRMSVPSVDELGSQSPVDLLKLQAMLVELHDLAIAEHSDSRHPAISAAVLDRLVAEEQSSLPRDRRSNPSVPGPKLVARALERYVDRKVLSRPADWGVSSSRLRILDQESRRCLSLRRAAAKMAEYFSTGSLKVPQYLPSLLENAWDAEWLTLGLESEQIGDELDQFARTRHTLESLSSALTVSDTPVASDAGILSGWARKERWSPAKAVTYLVSISEQALTALVEGNVLRKKGASAPLTYELVHDGFGPALADWAYDQLRSPEDAAIAITAQRGLEFNWDELTGEIHDVCWSGCWIGPTGPTGFVAMNDVQFVDCDLHGTLFERCIFKGGAFRNCQLDYVIFRSCSFIGTPEAPFLFEGGRATGLTFNGGSASHLKVRNMRLHKMWWSPGPAAGGDVGDFVISDVNLEHCPTINQWTVDNVRLDGPLTINDCQLAMSDLLGLTKDVARVHFRDSRLIYCPVNDELRDCINNSGVNKLDPNQVLPDYLEQILERAEPSI